jgi:hypothetical protein
VSSSKSALRRRLVGCCGRSDVVVEGSAEVAVEGSLVNSVVIALLEIVVD